MQTMAISEAREKLTSLHNFLDESGDTIAVTIRGKKVMALMSWDFYEALLDTLEILGDEKLTEKLRQSLRELKEGKLIPAEEV